MKKLFSDQYSHQKKDSRIKFKQQESSINPCHKKNDNETKLHKNDNYIYFQLNELFNLDRVINDMGTNKTSKNESNHLRMNSNSSDMN
jgi:hypothetical protein